MSVPSLPFSMSDVNAEFGAGSLATILAAEVGALPRSMSALEGLSDDLAIISVSATNIINNASNTDSGALVQGTSVVTLNPSSGTNASLSWSKISGDTISNSGSPNRTFSQFLNDGESVGAVYRVTATNSKGSKTDDITVDLSYTDVGS